MRLVHSEAGEYFACAWQLGNRHMEGLRAERERTYAAAPPLVGGGTCCVGNCR